LLCARLRPARLVASRRRLLRRHLAVARQPRPDKAQQQRPPRRPVKRLPVLPVDAQPARLGLAAVAAAADAAVRRRR
jgi:hypothetical protein